VVVAYRRQIQGSGERTRGTGPSLCRHARGEHCGGVALSGSAWAETSKCELIGSNVVRRWLSELGRRDATAAMANRWRDSRYTVGVV
jgi:hypothetical protein